MNFLNLSALVKSLHEVNYDFFLKLKFNLKFSLINYFKAKFFSFISKCQAMI